MLWLYRGRLKEEGTSKDNVASDDGGKKKQGGMELLIHSAPRGFRPHYVRAKKKVVLIDFTINNYSSGILQLYKNLLFVVYKVLQCHNLLILRLGMF